MKRTLHIFRIVGLTLCATLARAQNPSERRAEAEKLVQGLKYRQGEIDLNGGLAKLNVPPEFHFLGPEDTETVLVKLWHNPPSKQMLGMLLPVDKGPLNEDGWAVTISYTQDGYVKDDEAAKINYDKMLKEMKSAVHDSNKERAKLGYPTAELIGWAAEPRYDAQAHKLYWAKELAFDNSPEHTLNYNIRILGRRGVLVLNAISPMSELSDIENRAPQILSMVNFNDGNRYADFDPKIDRVATYGIAALVAGGVAAKLGLFKLVWVVLLAAKKFVILGIAAVAAWCRKIFGKRKGTAA